MQGSVGSGVLKKKSSSGCLIIKKTGLDKNPGGRLGDLSDGSKEKKRARLVASSSSSSDEDESLEIMRRRVNDKRLKNGSIGYKRNELENREHGSDNAAIEDSAVRMRSRFDLFEFDEYDEFDGKKMRNECSGSRFKTSGQNDSGKMQEYGVSSSRNFVMGKRKKQGSHFDGSSSGKSKEKGYNGARNKGSELDDDEAHMPISLLKLKYQEAADEPIRLQGKNGVLKVMVNKKKKMDYRSQRVNYDSRERKERKGSSSDDAVNKEFLLQSPVHSDSKTPENQHSIVDNERSTKKDKKVTALEKVKLSSNKGRKNGESEIDGTDTVKFAMPIPKTSSSKKQVKKEAEGSPDPENSTPVEGKDGKEGNAKHGGSTEKQMLREKIRGLLVDGGWTIDYRPRRNRDYLDAVYINPSGTAYWSIVKAYDAFKKYMDEDSGTVKSNVGSSPFAPLSEEINKLTRQTKKKISEELKRKRKENGITKSAKSTESPDSDQSEQRLSSYIKQKQKSRSKFYKVDQDGDDDINGDTPERKLSKVRVGKSSTASKSDVLQGRTSKVTGRCTLLIRGSSRGENSDFDGYVPYGGKRTVLAWLIDSGTTKLSEKVQYMNRRRSRVMLEGWITRDGIHCGCCSKILTVSKFELHAGSKLRQPFHNIFLESGASLLQCQIDAWNRQEESTRQDFFTVEVDGDDPDDDTCGICGDGGDLICCDSCPSTFHQTCLGIKTLPSGDWHCSNCTCKFCGNVAEENNSAGDELNRCHFCEKKYHKSCSERACMVLKSSNGASFCGPKCQEIYDHIEKILGNKHELEAGISWSLIQRKDVSDSSQRGFPLRVECNSKLAVALSVMDECFLPIIDRRSEINMIHNVVYNCGSNFNRLNFRRFYTAILERGDEIIAAASIRLHGDRLAEMPFIGTREIYRRQGMCRRLLSAIETELRSLKVKRLIIPAIEEHMNTWTTIFDFHDLEDVQKKEIKSMNMLVFPGTDMLQKQLGKQEDFDVGTKVSASMKKKPRLPVPIKESEADSSVEQSRKPTSGSGGCSESNTNAVDPDSPVTTIPSNAVCEFDKGTGAEEGNKQKETSDNPKCSASPAGSDNSSDNGHRFLEPSTETDGGDASENEAPSRRSVPISPVKAQNAAEATVSDNAIALQGSECVESVAGSIVEVSPPVSSLRDNEEGSAGLDREALIPARSDDVDQSLVQKAIDQPETCEPDRENKAVAQPDADLDREALLWKAIGCSETCQNDGENEAADCPENDEPDGENEAVDRHESEEHDGKNERPDGVNGNVQ